MIQIINKKNKIYKLFIRDMTKNNNTIRLSNSDIYRLVEEATNRVLSGGAQSDFIPDHLYHFTTISGALNIINYNFISLSAPTKKSVVDSKINNAYGYYNHLSFTTDGSIQTSPYPNQDNGKKEKTNVCFTVSTEKLKQHKFKLYPVQFSMVKANELIDYIKNNPSKESRRKSSFQNSIKYFINRGLQIDNSNDEKLCSDIKKLASDLDQKEIRIISNRTSIQNFSDYVEFVDFLVESDNKSQITQDGLLNIIGNKFHWIQKDWYSKIRVFTNKSDFDAKTNFKTIKDIKNTTSQHNYNKKEDELLDKIEEQDESITKTAFNALVTIFYCMSYTTKGIAAIQENAKKLMGNKFSYELYIDDDEDQGENHAVRLDLAIQEELETFDREYNSESGANVLKKNAQDAFNQLANHLSNNRYLMLDVTNLYILWLKRYTKSVQNKIHQMIVDLNSVRWTNVDDLFRIVKKYPKVFSVFFNDMLNQYAAQKLISLINSLNESNNKAIFIQLFNQIFTKFKSNVGKIKSTIVNYYANKFYHIDELLNYKTSVVKYRNKMLTQLQNTKGPTTFGDLAILYNNADKSNTENNLE